MASNPPGCVLGRHATWCPGIGRYVTFRVFLRNGKYWARPEVLTPEAEKAMQAATPGGLDSGPANCSGNVGPLLRALAASARWATPDAGQGVCLKIDRLTLSDERPEDGGSGPTFTEGGI